MQQVVQVRLSKSPEGVGDSGGKWVGGCGPGFKIPPDTETNQIKLAELLAEVLFLDIFIESSDILWLKI